MDEVSALLDVLGLSRTDFRVVTDSHVFKDILESLRSRGEMRDFDYYMLTEMLDPPYAELTMCPDDTCYIYLGPVVKDDVFTFYHALGHIYVFKKLGLFVNMALNYEAAEGCRAEDIDIVAMILGPVRNTVDDILADVAVYRALRLIDERRAEEFWLSAMRDAEKAAKVMTRLSVEIPGITNLLVYAAMLTESVYIRRTGLTKRASEKLSRYMERGGFQEAVELLDAIVYEMNHLTSYTVKKRIENKRGRTEYIMEVEIYVSCINIRGLG